MRIPIGVVEKIMKIMEEIQLVEYIELLAEHKKKFPVTFSIFDDVCEEYRRYYEKDIVHEIVIVRDCDVDIIEGFRTVSASTSFIKFYKSWY